MTACIGLVTPSIYLFSFVCIAEKVTTTRTPVSSSTLIMTVRSKSKLLALIKVLKHFY